MVHEWHLPTRGLETSAAVGPFLWYDFKEYGDDKYMRECLHVPNLQFICKW